MVERTILADGLTSQPPRSQLCRLAELTSWDISNISASLWRMYVPIDAGGEVSWNGKSYAMEPGSWLLIAPRTSARSRLRQPFRKAYHHFAWSIRGERARPAIYAGTIRMDQLRALRRIAEARRSVAADRELLLRMQALTAEALLSLPDDSMERDSGHGPELGRVVELLTADARHTPSNAELAAELELHPGSLVRMFTRELGVSPQRFALNWRLDQASALLTETDAPIDDIAERTGFGDRHHFSRAFARRWGRGPASYRRELRG